MWFMPLPKNKSPRVLINFLTKKGDLNMSNITFYQETINSWIVKNENETIGLIRYNRNKKTYSATRYVPLGEYFTIITVKTLTKAQQWILDGPKRDSIVFK